MVVYATGVSSIGIETADPNAFADIKTTTVYGGAFDIRRGQGNLELGFTNLANAKSGTSSFSVVTEPSFTTFGIIGNLGNNTTYYIAPGTIPVASLPSTIASRFEIPVTQNIILFAGTIKFSGTIPNSITMNIYKLIGGIGSDILVYTLQLVNGGPTQVTNQQSSVDFRQGDTYYATLTTAGNPGTGIFTATLAFY
jgi:hypothetical protein